jgi:shikimate kinase
MSAFSFQAVSFREQTMAGVTILLIGPRGSGKSSVGRRLAEVIGGEFADLDDHVLGRFGEGSVSEVWAAHGEQAWRRAEEEVFADLVQQRGQVIALGGGAPMIEGVQRRIRNEQAAGRALTIYLSAPPSVLAERIAGDPGDRPSLTGADPAEEIAAVLADRHETYDALADLTCDTSEGDASGIAAALADEVL